MVLLEGFKSTILKKLNWLSSNLLKHAKNTRNVHQIIGVIPDGLSSGTMTIIVKT